MSGITNRLRGSYQAALTVAFVQAETPPGDGVLQTVPSSPTVQLGRWVYGSVELANTGANDASITLEVETGEGTGSYTEVLRMERPADIGTHPIIWPYMAVVPPGHRYRFVFGGLAGVTETITLYNYHQA